MKEIGITLEKARSRQYPSRTITDADYTNDIALLATTPVKAESQQHILEGGIYPHENTDKTEFMRFNQRSDIATLNDGSLKLADNFTDIGSNVSSTENEINMQLAKAWSAILSDKIKRNFSKPVVSIIL